MPDVLLAAEIIWAAWGFVRAWTMGEADVTAAMSFTPGFAMQLYAALATGGTVFLVWWRWPQINAWRPKTRFRNLAPEIRNAMDRQLWDLTLSHEKGLESPIATSFTRAQIIKVAYGLDDLRIEHPPLRGENVFFMWRRFLPPLLAAAEMGEMGKAKNLWDEMRSQWPDN